MTLIFTVFGATGQQGGALIRYLLKHPRFSKKYTIRGVTRDINKPSAKALVEQGVEIVEADMDNLESLKEVIKGSSTVFAMTNCYAHNPSFLKLYSLTTQLVDWEKASATVEVAQGTAIADAAVASGVELFIWSSLPRLGLPNFDSKADVEVYIRTLPIKAVFYMPGWFMQNHLRFMKPKKRDTGLWVMEKPWPTADSNTLVPLVDVEDTGKYLQPFLDDPDSYNRARLTASTAFYTPVEMCETWSKVTRCDVQFEGSINEPGGVSIDDQAAEKDSIYYGVGSKKALDWTLFQMKEQPNSWESFVRTHEPWFV